MHAVVLAGGAGSRFWPASRAALPKPFVAFADGDTLFGATLARLRGLAPPQRTWVVAARALESPLRRALRNARGSKSRTAPRARLLLEPQARDTAAAIAWAAARVCAVDPEGVMGVFPADHRILRPAGFRRTVGAAARAAAREDALVLVGVEPTGPDSAYGYVGLGERGPGASFRVRRFVEKPSEARARRLLRSGDHLWNAGMIVARARVVLAETRAHAPEVWRALGKALQAVAEGHPVTRVTFERAWRRVRRISFDHAVLERSDRVLAVRGRFGWSDVGSWHALDAHLPRRGRDRAAGSAPLVTLDSRDNLVWNSTGKAVALVGLSDVVIVNTDDALLVCPKSRTQDVRRIVDELKRRRLAELL